MIENDGSILRPNVGPLSIQRGGIVVRPKNVEQLVVTDLRGIELHFHDLGVAGFIRANIFVGRVFLFAPGIANSGFSDAFEPAKSFLNAPKTSRPEHRLFRGHAAASNGNGRRARQRHLFPLGREKLALPNGSRSSILRAATLTVSFYGSSKSR